MSLHRTDSGIPVLTEIIANTPDDAEAAIDLSAPPAMPEPSQPIPAANGADGERELQNKIAAQVLQQLSQQLSSQFDALLDQYLHTALPRLLQAAMEGVADQLRRELKENLGAALNAAIKRNIADALQKSDVLENEK